MKGNIETLAESVFTAVKGYCSTEFARTFERMIEPFKKQIEALPAPKDGKDGRDASAEDVDRAVEKVVATLPKPVDGKDGLDGPSTEEVAAMVRSVVTTIPPPTNGADGKDADAAEITKQVLEKVTLALDQIPAPKDGRDGKDADPALIREIVKEEVAHLRDGMEGDACVSDDDCDPDNCTCDDGVCTQIEAMADKKAAPIVAKVLALLPAPVHGKDADAKAITADVLKTIGERLDQIPVPKDGADGLPGNHGRDGKDGALGANGDPGMDGPAGNAGTDGAAGADGADGVEGPQGIQGPQGIPGAAGKDGDPGPAGADGQDGADGAAGPKGDKGEPGADGVDGAKGDPGDQGPQGVQGPQGIQGIPGDCGADGAQGPHGAAGPQGDPGMPGTAGAKGMDGTNGLDGVPGIAGDHGRDGREGKDGAPGRDALQIDILPSIDVTRSYPRSTYACFKGGIIRSLRTTEPVGDDIVAAGWSVLIDAPKQIVVEQTSDRTFSFKHVDMFGRTAVQQEFSVPAMVYRGVFVEGTEYVQGDMATWAGSLWHCDQKTADKPGDGGAWRLAAKRGRDGKDGTVIQQKASGPVKV